MLLINKINTEYFPTLYIGNILQLKRSIPYFGVRYQGENKSKKPYSCTKFDIYPTLITCIYSSTNIYTLPLRFNISYTDPHNTIINQHYSPAL